MTRTLLAAVLAAPALFAAAPPPAFDARPVKALVEKLGDRSWAVREAAQRRLQGMGPRLLPHLLPSLASKDAEVRRRVLRLAMALESERDLAPRRMTASFRGAPLEKVLAALERQTGYRVHLEDPEEKAKPLTAEFRDAPFWDVLETLCQRNAMRVATVPCGCGIGLVPSRKPSRFVAVAGPFRASLTRVDVSRSANLEEDESPQPAQVALNLSVLAERRLAVLQVGPARVDAAYDDRSASMVPPPESATEIEVVPLPLPSIRELLAGGDGATHESQLALTLPSRASRSIKLLRGAVTVTVLVGRKASPLSDKLDKGAKFSLGDDTCSLASARRLPGLVLEAKVRIHRKRGAPQDDNDETAVGLMQELEFQDATGRKCPHEAMDLEGDTVTLHVLPAGTGRGRTAAMKLVHNKPLTRTTDIPFVFRNIPLP